MKLNVTVSNNNLDFSDQVKIFTFNSPPIVSSISPISGSSRGNINVTVTGSNFMPAAFHNEIIANAKCYFGTQMAAVVFINDTQIVCTLPPGSGTVPLTISLNGVDKYTQYPTQVVYFLYLDTSNTEHCRGTTELDFGTPFRTALNLNYYPDIFTQPGVSNFFNTTKIVTSASPQRPTTMAEPVAVSNNLPGGVADGDRCCLPTPTNQGRDCGFNFKDGNLCVLDVDFSAGNVRKQPKIPTQTRTRQKQ